MADMPSWTSMGLDLVCTIPFLLCTFSSKTCIYMNIVAASRWPVLVKIDLEVRPSRCLHLVLRRPRWILAADSHRAAPAAGSITTWLTPRPGQPTQRT